MTRQELFTWIRQQYGTEPEYPWHDRNAVLRHKDNNKWYGVVLEVSADKLGLPEAGIMDVLNVKSDPLLIGSLRVQDGYFPAYHMNKEKWISIQLGKPELDDAIKDLLSLSHELTAPKKRNNRFFHQFLTSNHSVTMVELPNGYFDKGDNYGRGYKGTDFEDSAGTEQFEAIFPVKEKKKLPGQLC